MKLALLTAALTASLLAQDDVKVADHQFIAPDEIKWGEGPQALPPGTQMAVLEGNPAKPGPFTLRLKFPANYKVQPHFHPGIEHVTVLSGTAHIGAGERYDETTTKPIGPGGFIVMQPGFRHYVWVKEETVVQLHAMGPWGVTYVNPADDPRTKAK